MGGCVRATWCWLAPLPALLAGVALEAAFGAVLAQASGHCAGIWRAQSASPRFLKVNDRIDMQADWLGSLSLTVKGAA